MRSKKREFHLPPAIGFLFVVGTTYIYNGSNNKRESPVLRGDVGGSALFSGAPRVPLDHLADAPRQPEDISSRRRGYIFDTPQAVLLPLSHGCLFNRSKQILAMRTVQDLENVMFALLLLVFKVGSMFLRDCVNLGKDRIDK